MEELERLEKWEQMANISSVGDAALGSLDAIHRQSMEHQSIAEHNKNVREESNRLLSTCMHNAGEWINSELNNGARLLTSGAIEAKVVDRELVQLNHKITPKVLLTSLTSFTLSFNDRNRPDRKIRYLFVFLCRKQEVQVRITVGQAKAARPQLETVLDPEMVLLPAFGENVPQVTPRQVECNGFFVRADKIGKSDGFLRDPLPRAGRPYMIHVRWSHYVNPFFENIVLNLPFRASEWHRKQADAKALMSEAFQTFLDSIAKDTTGITRIL